MTNEGSDIVAGSAARRLMDLFGGPVTEGSNDTRAIGAVLCQILRLGPSDTRAAWYRAFGELNSLVLEAESEAASLIPDFSGSPYALTLQTLRETLTNLPVESQWSLVHQQLGQVFKLALPFVVHHVEARQPPHKVSKDTLASIISGVDALVELVRLADLPDQLRNEVLNALLTLRDRLKRYAVFGSDGLKGAAVTVVGVFAMNEPQIKDKKEIVEATADTLNAVMDVILKAAGVVSLASPIAMKLLGHG